MEKPSTGGLGLALEGTVDVVNGAELRPHHYIQRMHPDGPAGKCGRFRSGDELLDVNGYQLYGVSHVDVRRAMNLLPGNGAVRLVVARRMQMPMQVDNVYTRIVYVQANVFQPPASAHANDVHQMSLVGTSTDSQYRLIIKAKSDHGECIGALHYPHL